jgi:hypothetical protein
MKAQKSKRARSFRKQALFARMPAVFSHPSHIRARDWQGFIKRNPLIMGTYRDRHEQTSNRAN